MIRIKQSPISENEMTKVPIKNLESQQLKTITRNLWSEPQGMQKTYTVQTKFWR